MVKHYDAIVVGGGVIGGSIAYYLARKHKRVLLLERSHIGSGTSQAAAGMLGAQSEMNEISPLFKLAVQSRAMFPKLAEELKELSGIDIELVMQGLLKVAVSAEQVEHFIQTVELQRHNGEVAEWLTAAEAHKFEPMLGEQIYGAMYFPNEGQVLAPSLNLAFVRSAEKLGAEVLEHTDVQSLLMNNGQVTGVMTANGAVFADQVVLAAGVWSKSLLEQVGMRLDLYPVKGECFSVTGNVQGLSTTIFSEGCYLVPKQGGRIVVGATMRQRDYDRNVTVAGMRELFDRAVQLLPAIADMSFERAWAGLRPQTPDGQPIIGVVPHCAGMYVAAGHYRNGILLSPITGKALAELMDVDSDNSSKLMSGAESHPLMHNSRFEHEQLAQHTDGKIAGTKQHQQQRIDLRPFGLERFDFVANEVI